ncbi:MAG TPA: low temperature requirement protein A [Burkholderiales bacterium]|nr:low temperature requirement protein A [Burkholderiales bacterium]
MASGAGHGILRARDGQEARVTSAELFFDLIYAFAVTQLSHHLLHDLTLAGALQTLVLWMAVWLGWQYTCWVTNWFDPDAMPIRVMLLAVMLVGLLMSSALPEAFEERGLVFACCYAGIQVGRTLYVLLALGGSHALTRNFQRIFGWLLISAAFWISGGLQHGEARLALWVIAVLCEYLSPMIGFRLPGLGASKSSDWTIEGGHLAERNQLFVMVALGESILVTGATIAGTGHWEAPILVAFVVAFLGSVAMWWMYFDTSSEAGTHAITRSDDPGLIGSWFHYVHAVIIAGIIVSAVADELYLAHPDGHMEMKHVAALVGGPALYVLGNAIYKRIVYGRLPLSHLAGLALLAALVPLAWTTDLLMVGGLSTLVMLVVATWEALSRRSIARGKGAEDRGPGAE